MQPAAPIVLQGCACNCAPTNSSAATILETSSSQSTPCAEQELRSTLAACLRFTSAGSLTHAVDLGPFLSCRSTSPKRADS